MLFCIQIKKEILKTEDYIIRTEVNHLSDDDHGETTCKQYDDSLSLSTIIILLLFISMFIISILLILLVVLETISGIISFLV